VKTDLKEQSATRSIVTVEFDSAEISNKRQSLIKDFSKNVKIPGFRSGKVPASLIEKRFEKELQGELDRALINEAYDKAIQKSEMDVFTVVDIEEGEFEVGKDGKVVFIVDVNPQFTLPEYKGIAITSESALVNEADVDQAVKMLLNDRAEFKVVEKEVAAGDYVKCSYEGKVGRKLISEIAPDQSILGTQKNTWEEAGNPDAPGVSSIIEGLIGMKVGETKKIEHTFADNHAIEALRKKKAVYTLEVHEVREKVLPEINKELLKSVNAESEEVLRERFKQSLESRKKQEIYGQQRQAVGDFLRSAVDFEIPDSAFVREKESIMEDFAQHNMQKGLSKEVMEEELTKNLDQIETTARARVKLDIVIGRIAREEKIEVSQKDLSQLLYSQAMQSGMPIDKLVQELKNDQERLNSLRQSALFNKTLQFLVDNANITELTA
jgi:trigger factor